MTWDSSNGHCTSCYEGYDLVDGECILPAGSGDSGSGDSGSGDSGSGDSGSGDSGSGDSG